MSSNCARFLNLVLITCLFSSVLFATEDTDLEFKFSRDRSFDNKLSPAETYSRTQSVLQYYNSPILPTGQDELSPLSNLQSYPHLKKILKYFDVNKMFDRLFTVTPIAFKGFEDLNGKTKLDFNVSLRPSNLKYQLNLQSTTDQLLKGLRVAIDPGHMGEPFWDELTGKYVKDSSGTYISEGIINLQTSLLLQKELESLGAQVKLTRTDLGPATDMTYSDLPISQFARRELLEQVFSPWFLKLLSVGTGNKLFNAFDQSSDRKKLWATSSRSNYFVLKEDLWARASKINSFNPDIVLIIHYDVLPNNGDGHAVNPNSPNQTKVYVSGAYFDTEFGSRLARSQFAKKLLDQTQWEESIRLGKEIVSEFKTQMHIDPTKSAENSIKVAPGIFSRNLTLSRFLNAPAVAYLECLFYNRPQEFYAFADTKYPMIINGMSHPYSDRLLQVVNTLKQAVVNYSENKK